MKNGVNIRKASSGDFEFIARLMCDTLPPFYDGDHYAHARRLFDTHMAGHQDTVGHFSYEQVIFIVEDENVPVGFVNLVGKKQGNYKISPLILDNQYRGKKGYGTILFDFMENYVLQNSCRQLYCTVAAANTSALTFFLKKGFRIAGVSQSHYKVGMNEYSLYKNYVAKGELVSMDNQHISVSEFDYKFKPEFERMVYEQISPNFKGVDESWIQATYNGFERRATGDVNTKYKEMFVATNQHGEFLGAMAITPKKGQPMKVMPLVAKTPQAFFSLLEELPKLVYGKGHKLYIHINPTAEQVSILQGLGWAIEAMMPNSYREGVVTQQWGKLINSNMATLRIKNLYFNFIKTGQKDVEVRVGYGQIKRIKADEDLQFLTHGDTITKTVEEVKVFNSFAEMFEEIDHARVVPGQSKENALKLLQEIYPPEKEALGVYAFVLK